MQKSNNHKVKNVFLQLMYHQILMLIFALSVVNTIYITIDTLSINYMASCCLPQSVFNSIVQVIITFIILFFIGYLVQKYNSKDIAWFTPIISLLLIYNLSIILYWQGLAGFPSSSLLETFMCMVGVFILGYIFCQVFSYLIRYLRPTDVRLEYFVALVPYICCTANMGYFGYPIVTVLIRDALMVTLYLGIMLAYQMQFFLFIQPVLTGLSTQGSSKSSVLEKVLFLPLICFLVGLVLRWLFPNICLTEFGKYVELFHKNLKITHGTLGFILMGASARFVIVEAFRNFGKVKSLKFIIYIVVLNYAVKLLFLFSAYTIVSYTSISVSHDMWVLWTLIYCLPPALNSLLIVIGNEQLAKEPEDMAHIIVFFTIATFVGIILSLCVLIFNFN